MSSPYPHEIAPENMHPVVGLLTGPSHPDCDRLEYILPSAKDIDIIPLGLPDYIIPKIWSPTIYPFENVNKASDFMSYVRLKESLQLALERIPILSGSLELCDGKPVDLASLSERMQVRLNKKGVMLGSSHIKGSFKELKKQDFIYELLPPDILFKEAQISVITEPFPPLLAVKVCCFDCGSVIILLMVHHCVADGRSSYEFMRLWGQIYNNTSPSSTLFDARHLYKPKENLTDVGRQLINKWENSTMARVFSKIPLKACRISITKSNIERIKMDINTKDNWVSTDDIFCAVIWRALTRVRKLEITHTTFQRAVDIRSQCGLNMETFGNGLSQYTIGPLSVENVLDMSISQLCCDIRSQLKEFTVEFVEDYMTALDNIEPIGNATEIIDNVTCDLFASSFKQFDPSQVDFHSSPALFIIREPYYEGHFVTHSPINDKLYGYISVNTNHLEHFLKDSELSQLGFQVEIAPFSKSLLDT